MSRANVALLALLTLVTSGGSASARETVPEFDARIGRELAGKDPEAARLWEEANAARLAERDQEAAELYAQIEARVPTSSHAFRRHCRQLANLHQRAEAVALCRKALELEHSAYNLAMLALALVSEPATDGQDLDEAARLADEAVDTAEEDNALAWALRVATEVARQQNNLATLTRVTDRLIVVEPDDGPVWLMASLGALAAGESDEAERRLDRAATLGVPAEQLAVVRAAIEDSRPWTHRWLPRIAWVMIPWLGVLVVLVVLGFALSRLALNAAARRPDEKTGRPVGMGGRLRRLYAAVLWAACAYYYLSIPIVLLVVLGTGGGLLYGRWTVGGVNPAKLIALIVALMVATVWAVVKSLFTRARDEEPGRSVELARHPRLVACLAEVAAKVGTRAVDKVYLTPDVEVAVLERGGVLEQLRSTRERCLILGVATLDGLELGPFKSILAHEYGHLSNEDTAGGGFALAVRRSLLTMAEGLGGAAVWYNPAWLFLNGFYRVFLRISQGASRLQEVLADRWAAFSYGPAAFEAGLRHVVSRTVRFDEHATVTLVEVCEGERRLQNLYRYRPARPMDETQLDEAVEKALHAEPSPYASHPSPADRFAWVHALPGTPTSGEPGLAWDLFEDRERVERDMTAAVRANVARMHGVAIAAEQAAAESTPG